MTSQLFIHRDRVIPVMFCLFLLISLASLNTQ